MPPSVAVLTPTLPERTPLLSECLASVQAQTRPVEHHVLLDVGAEGPGPIRNQLADRAEAEWLLPLDDDDLLDPDAVECLLEAADGADVVYPWCRVEGSDWCPNRLFGAEALRRANYIPVTALVRRSLWTELQGWRECELEDYDFWLRALDAGATFRCLPEVLWTFRIGAWRHRNPWQERGAA